MLKYFLPLKRSLYFPLILKGIETFLWAPKVLWALGTEPAVAPG